MSRLRILPRATHRIDDIYLSTAERCGADQADRCLRGLYAIAAHAFPWRSVPAEFGIEGYICRYESHMIYWRALPNGDIGIVTVLHGHMHQISRLRDDFEAGAVEP